jgi:hypothetical protein
MKAIFKSYKNSKIPSWGKSFTRKCPLLGTKSSGELKPSSFTVECSLVKCSLSFAKLTPNRSTKAQSLLSNQPGPTCARMRTCGAFKRPSDHTNKRWIKLSMNHMAKKRSLSLTMMGSKKHTRMFYRT